MTHKEKIDAVYNSIWKDVLENDDGSLDFEAVKKELYDYAVLFKNTQTAYLQLTGGEVSNPFTQLDVLLSYIDLWQQELVQYASDEDRQEETETFKEERSSLFDVPYSKATIH